MTAQTITGIRELLGSLKEQIANLDVKEYKGQSFGPENEYDAPMVKRHLKSLLATYERALEQEDVFVEVFTLQDRQTICNQLSGINQCLSQHDLPSIANGLEILKPYTSRMSEHRRKVTSNLYKEGSNLLEVMERYRNLPLSPDQLEEKIEEIQGLENNYKDVIAKAEAILEDMTNWKSTAAEDKDVIEGMKAEVEAFFNDIGKHKEKLQEANEWFTGAQQRMDDMNEEAEAIINKAKEAHAFGERSGLVAAFGERVKQDAKDKISRGGWFIGGVLALSVAFVTVFVLYTGWEYLGIPPSNEGASFLSIMAKLGISIAPFYVAWFCLSQYSKSKNLVEDYKYKAIVVQSMEAFLAQFKEDPENQTLYLQVVFDQVFKDPLRKKHDAITPISEIVAGVQKMIDGRKDAK